MKRRKVKICPFCKGVADIEQITIPCVSLQEGGKFEITDTTGGNEGFFLANCCARVLTSDMYIATNFCTKWLPRNNAKEQRDKEQRDRSLI